MNRKIILMQDVVFKKGTILNEISGSTSQFSDDWFQGLISLNKDNAADLNINLDALKEGKDFIYIKD